MICKDCQRAADQPPLTFEKKEIRATLSGLKRYGSRTSPLDSSEGIAIFHTQSRQTYKVTLDGNDAGKREAI